MPVLVGQGDKLVMRNGSVSSMPHSSVPFGMWAGGGSLALSGDGRTISYQGLYESQPWVAAVVNKLNRQIARLPLKVYRTVDQDGGRERLRDHPLVETLKHPYHLAGAVQLKQKLAFPTLLHGNALLWKASRGLGTRTEGLIPLDWRYTTPVTDATGDILAWKLDHPESETRYFAREDVIHIAWEGGTGGIGVSPLRQLGVTLRTEEAAQQYQSSSFDNGARPSGAMVLPPDVKLRREDRDELRQEIRNSYAGVANAHKIALMFGGAKWEAMSQTAVDAELIEQRKLNREEVAAVYDMPPPMIGILDKATYSNIETQHQMLYTDVIGPWLVLIEEALQSQLIDTYQPWVDEGLFVEFDLAEVLKGDTLKEVRAIREAIATGILTPNEARAIRNMPPSEQDGMNAFYLPTNNMGQVGTGDEPDAPDAIARQVEKAAHRVERKDPRGIDPARIERELTQDLDDPHRAREWASRIEDAGDPAAIRALLTQ